MCCRMHIDIDLAWRMGLSGPAWAVWAVWTRLDASGVVWGASGRVWARAWALVWARLGRMAASGAVCACAWVRVWGRLGRLGERLGRLGRVWGVCASAWGVCTRSAGGPTTGGEGRAPYLHNCHTADVGRGAARWVGVWRRPRAAAHACWRRVRKRRKSAENEEED
jgi:hypothetical protein